MKQFSFANTICLIDGVEVVEWAAGEDAFNMRRRAESFLDVVGVNGDMAVYQTSDQTGEFEVKLMQTSTTNEYLTSRLVAAENGAFVPVSVMFKDLGGNDLGVGTNGYIQKFPEVQRGAGIATQPWLIVIERLDMLLNGADTL